jgi:hypothetical protein
MFWAVEGMAAELSTGALCISKVRARTESVDARRGSGSRLLQRRRRPDPLHLRSGAEVDAALQRAFETMEPQAVKLRSVGVDEQHDRVAEFVFTWSFKARRDVFESRIH